MLAIRHNYFSIFPTHYLMSLTMIFGSMVAGATSEGGGAVAFPVMTLALKIPPSIARDFSLMTQSCGEKKIYIVNKTNFSVLSSFSNQNRKFSLIKSTYEVNIVQYLFNEANYKIFKLQNKNFYNTINFNGCPSINFYTCSNTRYGDCWLLHSLHEDKG